MSTDSDVIKDAVRLGLADGKASALFGVTREPLVFRFNPGTQTDTVLKVRAVITAAPYDFLVGNVVLWTLGGIVDAWREQFRYRLHWREGPRGAGDIEGFIPIRYERETGARRMPQVFYNSMLLRQGGVNGWRVYGPQRVPTPESLPDLVSDNESGSASPAGSIPDLNELPDFLEVASPDSSRSSTPDSLPDLEPVGQMELGQPGAGAAVVAAEHEGWHGVYYRDDPDFRFVAPYPMEDRWLWWLEYIATGQVGRSAVSRSNWDEERARLHRRATDLEDSLFGQQRLPEWHPEMAQRRRELSQIYTLILVYMAWLDFHNEEFAVMESVRSWEAQLHRALDWSVRERRALRLEDMVQVCPRAARLGLSGGEADSTARRLEQVMANGAAQRHNSVHVRNIVTCLRRQTRNDIQHSVDTPPYLLARPGLAVSREERQGFQPAFKRTLVSCHTHLSKLLAGIPDPAGPVDPQEVAHRELVHGVTPLWGSLEGYPPPALNYMRRQDEWGRPEPPPGWDYRLQTSHIYYRELYEFLAVHPRSLEEQFWVERNWERIGNFRNRDFPQMDDLLLMQNQRRREPPVVEVGEDETAPAAEADPDALEDWVPPAADVPWDGLPQGLLTQPPVGQELSFIGSRTAYYRETVGLNSVPTFSPIFAEDLYITVMLLFGGIGAELEGLLRAGLYIKRLFYVENDPGARIAFGTRLRDLHHRYPEQLGPQAFHTTQSSMPWDIREVGERELRRAVGSECQDPINLVTISSPCQGFSRANRQALGLEDERSGLIVEAWRILDLLQQIQRPWGFDVGFIFEMVDASDHPSPPARWGFEQLDAICGGQPGQGVLIDAAKLGSAAHRVRTFWTNLAPGPLIQARYNEYDRGQAMNKVEARDVLEPFRTVQSALEDDPRVRGYFPMNVAGEPIRVFPTLVATPGSYAFRFQGPDRPGPGMIYDRNKREWDEPNANERERIMGLIPGSTAAPGLTEANRRRLVGAAIDVRAFYWLCKEIRRWRVLNYDED